MKKALAILMVIMLVLVVGSPVFAGSDMMKVKYSTTYAFAGWLIGEWGDLEGYMTKEVTIEEASAQHYLLTIYSVEWVYTEYPPEPEPKDGEDGGYFEPIIEVLVSEEIPMADFTFTISRKGAAASLDTVTQAIGRVEIDWTLNEIYQSRSNSFSEYDGNRTHAKNAYAEAYGTVSGIFLGETYNPENTGDNTGYIYTQSGMEFTKGNIPFYGGIPAEYAIFSKLW